MGKADLYNNKFASNMEQSNSATLVVQGHFEEDESLQVVDKDPEFEMWVEAELEAGWCLKGDDETTSTDISPQEISWRDSCATATVLRKWDDFESLMTQRERDARLHGKTLAPTMDVQESWHTLGLNEGASLAEIKAAFRRCTRECHPDKGGTEEAFCKLIAAYQN